MFQKKFLLGNTIEESFTITDKRLLFAAHHDKHFFLKGKVFLLKAENSCHIPRHINCLVIFQQGAQTHQRKMLEHIQNTQFTEH